MTAPPTTLAMALSSSSGYREAIALAGGVAFRVLASQRAPAVPVDALSSVMIVAALWFLDPLAKLQSVARLQYPMNYSQPL